MEIFYKHGGWDLLDSIQPLWAELNAHHAAISSHFGPEFEVYSFEQRQTKLHNRYASGQLRIDLAQVNNQIVGYLISGLSAEGVGEIESIYLLAAYRGQLIAETLMQRALDWLDAEGAQSKVIEVAVGNQRVYNFYARFGFYPRVVILKQKGHV